MRLASFPVTEAQPNVVCRVCAAALAASGPQDLSHEPDPAEHETDHRNDVRAHGEVETVLRVSRLAINARTGTTGDGRTSPRRPGANRAKDSNRGKAKANLLQHARTLTQRLPSPWGFRAGRPHRRSQ